MSDQGDDKGIKELRLDAEADEARLAAIEAEAREVRAAIRARAKAMRLLSKSSEHTGPHHASELDRGDLVNPIYERLLADHPEPVLRVDLARDTGFSRTKLRPKLGNLRKRKIIWDPDPEINIALTDPFGIEAAERSLRAVGKKSPRRL